MINRIIAAGLFIFLLNAFSTPNLPPRLAAQDNTVKEEIRIGVSTLEKQGDVKKELADTVSDLVKVSLQQHGNVKVIPLGNERKVLLRELELHQTGLVDDKYKIDPGKFMGAGKILQGKISKLLNAYFITLHVLDVKTGVYDLSRKVTVCTEEEIPRRIADLVNSVVTGLVGVFQDPDRVYGSCTSPEQTRGLDTFKDIVKSQGLEEIPVRYIQASSVLYEAGFDHNPWMMIDGVVETAWADGNDKKSGVGEWLLFSFDANKTIQEIAIINGLGLISGKWGNLYTANASLKSAELLYSNGMRETVSFKRTHEVQRITLRKAENIHWAKFTITGEYPGTRFKDTCISEIKFFGRNAYTFTVTGRDTAVMGGIHFVKIPAGTYTMGTDNSDTETSKPFCPIRLP